MIVWADSKTGSTVVELLVGLHRRDQVGLLIVTHQSNLAELAERVVALEDGKIVTERGRSA